VKKVWLAGLVLMAGCGPFRRAQVPPPPGPTPVRIPEQVTSMEPAPPPKNLPAPPPVEGLAVEAKPATALGLPGTPTAGPPKVAKVRRPAKRKAVAVKPAAPAPVAEEPAPAAPPYRLGELRSAEETARLRRQTERLLARCAEALGAVEGRSLTGKQSELMGRVKAFAQQAKDVLDKDPGEARGFAAKGRTFAEALLAELK
jgi:hypothetical protein